ncbi:MAG TPA: S41 family peptidase [Pyrinomonadaceae bacterium]|nr:S41 family peptidase [Pyrinomonadaceae bacterium]
MKPPLKFLPGVFHAVALSAAALVCVASLVGCRQAAPVPAASPAESTLSQQERVEIFEQVWRTIDEEYYDPNFRGVDWRAARDRYRPQAESAPSDAEFYGVFEQMLSELRDGHTVFVPPERPGRRPEEGGPRGSVGVRLGDAEGRVAVVEVEAGSQAERLGVRPGHVLREVNGRPVEEHVAFIRSKIAGSSTERLFRLKMLSALLYAGFLAKPRTLGLTDFDGREFNVELPEEPARADAPNLTSRRLDSGFGYVRFRSWTPPAQDEFREALKSLRDAPGLVIDLRGNGGGQARVLLDIASNFFDRPTHIGGSRARSGEVQKTYTRRAEQPYRGPVVVLVDEATGSASEAFTGFMQEVGRARVVGRQTAGSTLSRNGARRIKGGGQLLFSTHTSLTPAGRELEGVGVTPDVAVALTLADLRAGRDAALEEAESLLRRRENF